jgi:hypothetical protein
MNVTLEIAKELRKDGGRHAELERFELHDTIVYPEPHYDDLSVRRQDVFQLKDHVAYIRRLVEQGGPRESDFSTLDYWIIDVHTAWHTGKLSGSELAEIRAAFGDALSPSTMQGFALTKPHGYPGDFEVIDRMYQMSVSSDPRLANWDRFFHQHAAPKAVRNRKTYFHRLLDRHSVRKQPLRVLKIASGPGRSMFEWLSAHPNAPVTFECVEIDLNAIDYASRLNERFLDRIAFVQKNAMRYRPSGEYDLIWAAGIFDYFDDRTFISLFERLVPALAEGGELVVGNFSDRNPSRAYMELLGGWSLHHRTDNHLMRLARECGVAPNRISAGTEPEHVNLFLHVSSHRKNVA